MIINTRISSFEIDEVLADLLGIDSEDSSEIEEALAEKYNLDISDFHEIFQSLFDRIRLGISPLSVTPFIGFCNTADTMWLTKREYEEQFINSVVQWLTEGEDVSNVKGFSRIITKEGEPEFEIIIKKIQK